MKIAVHCALCDGDGAPRSPRLPRGRFGGLTKSRRSGDLCQLCLVIVAQLDSTGLQ